MKTNATMRAMLRSLRSYFIALIVVSIALAMAAHIYTEKYPAQSHWIMSGVLPAFLFEAVFFLGAVFERTRQLLAGLRRAALLSLVQLASALVPFWIVTKTAGTYDAHAF